MKIVRRKNNRGSLGDILQEASGAYDQFTAARILKSAHSETTSSKQDLVFGVHRMQRSSGGRAESQASRSHILVEYNFSDRVLSEDSEGILLLGFGV